MSQTQSKDFFKEYINTFAYSNKNNQKVAAINLWTNGLKIIDGATVVKEFDIYKNIRFTETQQPTSEISLFIKDSLMDAIRIITCFENFMKGILILNDCLVHKLTQKSGSLQEQQKKRPIAISEIFNELSFSDFDPTKPKLWHTMTDTVNFSWMLKPKYQAIINLPEDVLTIVTEINEKRNILHFIIVDRFQFGKPTIDNYSKIIDFAHTTIRKCILDLDENMKEILKTIHAE